jgi:hypothetical protein
MDLNFLILGINPFFYCMSQLFSYCLWLIFSKLYYISFWVFIVLFSYTIYNTHPPYLPSFTLPLPTGTHPQTDLFYLPVLHFFKCMLIVQEDFTLIFHTCIYHTLIRLTSSITYSFSITLVTCYSLTFSALCYTIFMHRCNVSIIHSLLFSFSLLPPHSSLRGLFLSLLPPYSPL